jgi:aspartyl-tRNA synthetase
MKITLNADALKRKGKVRVAGWAENVRRMGKIKFVSLRDVSGNLQVTLVKSKVSDDLFNLVDSITKESVLLVEGKLQLSKIAPGGKELIPSNIELVSKAEQPVPLNISGKIESDLSSRLNWRFLDLRMPIVSAIFKVQNVISHAFRDYFFRKGFIEVQPPCVISSASEGGANLYEIKYFEKKAYLAQSPQLYKQMCIAAGMHKVFMTVPVWRAEPHETVRHLNESRQCDIEVAFIDEKEALDYLEAVLKHIVKEVRNKCKEELKLLNLKLGTPKFFRITYSEAVDKLKKSGFSIKWGDDFTPEAERKLCELHGLGNFVFVQRYPSKLRSFYEMPSNDGKTNLDYDALHNGVEILSGAVRIHTPELLEKRIREAGLNPKNFKHYLDAFRYGCPPHAGWSFGLERLTMTLLGLNNVREASLFPRDRYRLTP